MRRNEKELQPLGAAAKSLRKVKKKTKKKKMRKNLPMNWARRRAGQGWTWEIERGQQSKNKK